MKGLYQRRLNYYYSYYNYYLRSSLNLVGKHIHADTGQVVVVTVVVVVVAAAGGGGGGFVFIIVVSGFCC